MEIRVLSVVRGSVTVHLSVAVVALEEADCKAFREGIQSLPGRDVLQFYHQDKPVQTCIDLKMSL